MALAKYDQELLSACKSKDVDKAKKALKGGWFFQPANVNLPESPPLVAALTVYSENSEADIHNMVPLVEMMLAEGADANLGPGSEETETGITPLVQLVRSAEYMPLDRVKTLFAMLVSNGCDLEKRDLNEETALFKAVKNSVDYNNGRNSLEVVKMLLEEGANARISNKYDISPMYISCENHSIPMIKLLLEHKCRVNHADKHGRTPLFYVFTSLSKSGNSRSSCEKFLISKGAKRKLVDMDEVEKILKFQKSLADADSNRWAAMENMDPHEYKIR